MQTNTFYTVSPSTGKVAIVRRATCSCGRTIIKSAPDAVIDAILWDFRGTLFNDEANGLVGPQRGDEHRPDDR